MDQLKISAKQDHLDNVSCIVEDYEVSFDSVSFTTKTKRNWVGQSQVSMYIGAPIFKWLINFNDKKCL